MSTKEYLVTVNVVVISTLVATLSMEA